MNRTITVQLGEQLFPVIPQKHARIRHKLRGEDLSKLVAGITTGEYATDAYRIICILIPSVDPESPSNRTTGGGMPFWQFDGFPTKELWERYQNGDDEAYDEDNDPCPTTRQIIEAIQTALSVSGGDVLGKMMGLVETGAKVALQQGTPLSQPSPGNTGASPSTTTGTTPQTSIENGAFPSPDSEN